MLSHGICFFLKAKPEKKNDNVYNISRKPNSSIKYKTF